MTTQEWESTLNIRLAGVLRELGLTARPEVIYPGNKRIDVEVRIGPAMIPVEAEHGQTPAKRRSAIGDADARLQQGFAQCAIAVCYPNNTTEESLPAAQVIWTVRDGSAPANWIEGSIERLAAVIRLAPAQLGDPDYVAASLSSSLNGAVRRLSESQKQELSRAIDLPPQTKNKRPVPHPWDAPAKRALLLVATAVMFHSRLDSHRNDLRPEFDNRFIPPPTPFTGEWPPAMAQQCAESSDPVGAFSAAWNLILALDYKPIFETGRAALLSCAQDPAFAAAIRDTAEASLVASRDIAGFRHDLLGRIFHTVLDTARYDGSFYTTTPAATLLANLAINEQTCDWSDPAAIARLRITDPACGTGTLLMAAAQRIQALAPRVKDDENLAAALIEQVLSGYDVNLTATHMAATTLGLLSPTTQFKNMKIGRALLGVERGKAYLGSLEFLERQPRLMPWPNAAQAVTQVDSGEEIAQIDPADLVIMNPPFTRSDLRHNQFSVQDERLIQNREKQLFSNKPVHLSSNGNAFLVLADYINKAESSAIASVLPLVTATNVSALEIRKHLASRYHIETIVTSHDPERVYFSENTTIGEMLLVCRRWSDGQGRKPDTLVVNLSRNPSTPAEALNVADAVKQGTVVAQGYGTVQQWPAGRIAAGDWGGVQFLSPNLAEKFVALRRNEFFAGLELGEIAQIGPSGGAVRGTFDRQPLPNARGMAALWDYKTDVTQGMLARPDAHLSPKSGKAAQADNLWQQRSHLLLPERVRLNTVRAFAVRLEERVLGSAWVPCRPEVSGLDTATLERALCAYINSSVGVLAMLGNRSNTTPSYPRFSIDDMRKVRAPDFAALGKRAVTRLAADYDRYANAVLLPLPKMNDCPVRAALDRAVIDALGVDEEEVASIRRQLAREPSVTGQRYAGAGG